MCPDELSGPDLAGVVDDGREAGLDRVVIGGSSVIHHGYVRATRDSNLLVPDGPGADLALVRFLDRVRATRLGDGGRPGPEEVSRSELGAIHGPLPIEPIPGLDT